VEPPKFTASELAALIAETISWMKEQRENFLPSSIPLNSAEKIHLQPFFTAQTLDQLRIAKLSRPGESIPYPPYYEKVRAGGARVLPDPAHTTAAPFIDVAVFNTEPTLRTIFHSLVHVAQFAIVGVERVVEGYFRTLNESGLWIVAPYEEQAYQMDARYTRDPSDVFSVEMEIQEWLRTGRYWKDPEEKS
jgi:hypothetical protein